MLRLALVLVAVPPLGMPAAHAEPSLRLIEDFSSSDIGSFPANWKRAKKDPEAPYDVRVEGENKFLHALDRGQSIKIFRRAEWSPKEYPYLRFRWRAHRLPVGANEKVKNDSAAGVYVLFERRGIQIVPHALKYVWSAGLPVGDAVRTGRGSNQIIVLQSGEDRLGEWTEHTVNVCRDYAVHFGKSPPDVGAIGVLTDANATDSIAEADYDDFAILTADRPAGSELSADPCAP